MYRSNIDEVYELIYEIVSKYFDNALCRLFRLGCSTDLGSGFDRKLMARLRELLDLRSISDKDLYQKMMRRSYLNYLVVYFNETERTCGEGELESFARLVKEGRMLSE